MAVGRFLFFTTIGAGLWNTILALIGYFIYKFTEIKTTEDVYLMATRYSHELGYAILGIAALVVCYLIYKGRKSKKA